MFFAFFTAIDKQEMIAKHQINKTCSIDFLLCINTKFTRVAGSYFSVQCSCRASVLAVVYKANKAINIQPFNQ